MSTNQPQICKVCRFYQLLQEPAHGRCRRFPVYELHMAEDWCGEFQAQEADPVAVSPPTAATATSVPTVAKPKGSRRL